MFWCFSDISSEVTHLFALFNLCRHDSHIFLSLILPPPPLFVSSSPAAWLMWCSRGRNRWRAGEGAWITLSPSARHMLWRCHQTVYGTAATHHQREGDRWVGCCRSHGCWMTHADPHSKSVTHQSHHSDFAQIRGRWPCCTDVAPAAGSPLPHQGGAADHTGSNLQYTAASPASLLTFKFVLWKEHTVCSVYMKHKTVYLTCPLLNISFFFNKLHL